MNRIVFPGNPWPNGHRVASFVWTGELEEDGAYFDLHLESADYDEEAPGVPRTGERDDWKEPSVWTNYHACILSSTHWGEHRGLRVGSADHKLDLDALGGRELHVDPLPRDPGSEAAFGIYLLGHDAVADHRIRFTKGERSAFGVSWSARVALAYTGETEYRHVLEISIARALFEGFEVPVGLREHEARALLARFVARPERFAWEEDDGTFFFVPID